MQYLNTNLSVLFWPVEGNSGLCSHQPRRRRQQQANQREIPSDRLQKRADSNRVAVENLLSE